MIEIKSEKTVRSILFIVFFFSGVTALIYQMAWIRMFGLVFGVSVYAVSTVLTAFMTGLALGNYIFGRIIDKYIKTLNIFIFIELSIALFALAFPFTFNWFKTAYISFHQLFPTSFYASSLIRFVFSFLFLLIPTTLMGGTLPVLTKFFVRHLDHLGQNVGKLYSVNNLGAFAGCFIAGFILVQVLGTTETIILAAMINLTNALVVFLIRPKNYNIETDGLPYEIENKDIQTYPGYAVKLALWVFAIEGFTTLSYEVIWTRILLGFSFDKSVYFYSTVVLSFIFGLSLGSWLISFWVDRYKNLLVLIGWIEVCIGLVSISLLPVFSKIGVYLESVRPLYVNSWFAHLGKEYFLFFIVMLLPVILMGATFPIVSKIYTQHMRQLGSRIGVVGALDTVGSIFGSFIAGFIFIPFLGVVNSVLLTAAVNLFIGFLIFIFHPFMKKLSRIVIVTAAILCTVILLRAVPEKEYFQNWLTNQPEDRLLFYKEGVSSTVSVPQHLDGVKDLSINGAISGQDSYGDLEVHKMEGYLPYLLNKNPKNALLIGMGMGVTANCLIQSDMNYVDCVEICPEVNEAAEIAFFPVNDHVVKNPKLNLIIEDGRSYLLITTKKYDIITSSGIHPRMSPNIYTKEFYEICRDRLADNGVMCKWFPSNWMSESEFKMLVKSFTDVFPYSSMWVGNASQAILVGAKRPFEIDLDLLSEKMKTEKIHRDLKASFMEDPEKLLSKFVCTGQSLQAYLQDAAVNSDDNPVVEYSRYMNKARNPEIIWDLIGLKQDEASILPTQSGTSTMNNEKGRRYFNAEKQFMIANIVNFFGDRQQEMIDALNKTIELDPQNYRGHESLAIIYYKSGKYQESLDEMTKIIELSPGKSENYENTGRIYFDMRDNSHAFEMFQKAIRINPELALSHYYLALLFVADNKTDSAISEFKKAIELYPKFVRAHFDLGVLYYSMNKFKSAQACFKRCLEIQPDQVDAKKFLEKIEIR
jgi:spermidine synthase